MRTVLFLLFLTSCGYSQRFVQNCGITVAGDIDDRFGKSFLTQKDLNRAVEKALDGASLAKDKRFLLAQQNCRAMVPYRVYTRSRRSWRSGDHFVAGQTYCDLGYIVIGTPADNDFRHSALIHELFHVMQNCRAFLPVDFGLDEWHANWGRDDIYKSIEYENGRP